MYHRTAELPPLPHLIPPLTLHVLSTFIAQRRRDLTSLRDNRHSLHQPTNHTQEDQERGAARPGGWCMIAYKTRPTNNNNGSILTSLSAPLPFMQVVVRGTECTHMPRTTQHFYPTHSRPCIATDGHVRGHITAY